MAVFQVPPLGRNGPLDEGNYGGKGAAAGQAARYGISRQSRAGGVGEGASSFLEGRGAVPGALLCPAFRTACAGGAGGYAGCESRPACNLYSGAPVPAHLSPHPGFASQIRTQADGARLDAPRAFLSCRQPCSGRESGRRHRARSACGRTAHAGELSSSGPGGGQYPPSGKTGRRRPCAGCPRPGFRSSGNDGGRRRAVEAHA